MTKGLLAFFCLERRPVWRTEPGAGFPSRARGAQKTTPQAYWNIPRRRFRAPRAQQGSRFLATGAKPIGALVLAGLLALGACRDRREVAVFHAASLARAFKKAGDAFTREQPNFKVRLEVSGSQTAARKVAELGMRADIVAAADPEVIDRILMPRFARWRLDFCTNELVLAHAVHSVFTEEVTAANWPQILERPGVEIGCVDPNLAPLGYRTLLAWQLAEAHYGAPGLASRLRARCVSSLTMPSEAELVQLLVTRAIDYAFVYRSTAFEQRLKATALPASINLGQRQQADHYSQAHTKVRMQSGGQTVTVKGKPIRYGITIITDAPNPDGAAAFLAFLFAESGRRILTQSGFRAPPAVTIAGEEAALPEALRGLVEKAVTPRSR